MNEAAAQRELEKESARRNTHRESQTGAIYVSTSVHTKGGEASIYARTPVPTAEIRDFVLTT